MSIIRRWQSGAETGLINEAPIVAGGATAVVTSPIKTGNYSYRVYYNGNYFAVDITETSQCRVGIFFNSDTLLSTSVTNRLITIYTAALSEIISVRIQGQSSGYPLRLYVLGSLQDSLSDAHSDSTWYHLGIDVKIDNSTGWATVYKDGTQILSFSGNTGSTNAGNIRIGGAGGAAEPTFVDDMYIDDTTGEASASSPPILYFYPINPNATGTYSQWIGSDGDSTDNYALVDEVPPNDSDYVVTTGTNYLDSYNMSTVSLSNGQIIEAVIPIVRTQRTDSTEQIVIGTRLSSTNLLGTVRNPSASFDFIWERLTGTPAGSSWQQSDLDNVELLIASTGTY